MDMVGIKKSDRLLCLDLVQRARNEVKTIKALKVFVAKGHAKNQITNMFFMKPGAGGA